MAEKPKLTREDRLAKAHFAKAAADIEAGLAQVRAANAESWVRVKEAELEVARAEAERRR